MAIDAPMSGGHLLVARLVFGYMFLKVGIEHFTKTDWMTELAESNGLPAARLLVAVSGVMLILGSLGIILGIYPIIAAGMLAVFLVIALPTMHPYWEYEGDERIHEQIIFQKDLSLLGASLAFLVLGGETWLYSFNIGM